MIRSIAYTASFVLPLAQLVGLLAGGWWTTLPLIVAFIGFPVLDALFGEDHSDNAAHAWHGWLLVAWVPIQVTSLAATLFWAPELGWFAIPALLSSATVTAGGGFTVAHELMHHPSRFDRALAEVLMQSGCYPHFCVEHVLGHHKNVATPLDPASSRRGEMLYPFLLRTLTGGLKSAWKLESNRVKRHKARGLADRRIRYPVTLALVGLALLVVQPMAAVLFLINGILSILLLESINYVEHYGLTRRMVGTKYEPTQPHHSWNSAHVATNGLLFQLPRHSDHHANPKRPFDTLRSFENAPQFPYGYPTMVLIALVPPLWFAIMNPRVDAWRQSQPSLAA